MEHVSEEAFHKFNEIRQNLGQNSVLAKVKLKIAF